MKIFQMKKLIIFFSLVQFLFSCSNKQNGQRYIFQQFERWDKILYEQPAAILDSLNKINTTGLSAANAAYHSLLYTMAHERTNDIAENDSIISLSLAWYREGKDYYNLCRSLLYKGIVLYEINHTDSSAYYPIKESEELYLNKKIEDNYLGSLIFTYLGKINRSRSNLLQAESYFKKSIELSTSVKSVKDAQRARIELFWTYLAQRKYSEALSNIITFESTDTISPRMQYRLYHALSDYYSAKQEFNISIEYLKKMLKLKNEENLKINNSKLYHSLSLYYKKIDKLDSALHYSQLAVKNITDTLSKDNHLYYKYLADIYTSLGDNQRAFENYKNAYASYIVAYSRISQNKVLEIERKYDISRKEIQLSKLKIQSTLLLNSIISLISFSILVILIYRLRIKKHKIRIANAETQKCSAETELKRAWFLNELLKASAVLLPQFIEDVNKEAAKSRKISKDLFDNLNNSIDNIKTLSRNKITAITKNEAFRSLNPNIEYLTDLSDFEKIILLLIDYNYSVPEISELLNTSQSSIRSIKTKIKEKILATKDLPFDPSTTFSIFK